MASITKPFKFIAAATGLTGAWVAVSGFSASARNERRFHPDELASHGLEEQQVTLPALPTGGELMASSELSGPMEGRGQFEWRNRFRPGAEQELATQAINPNMNVVPDEAVQSINVRGS